MNTVKIEVNGVNIADLAEKLDNLTSVLSGQSRPNHKPQTTTN